MFLVSLKKEKNLNNEKKYETGKRRGKKEEKYHRIKSSLHLTYTTTAKEEYISSFIRGKIRVK